MEINTLANKVIEKLKGLPNDVLFTQADTRPRTPWDAYKEHYQYEEDQIFNLDEFNTLMDSYVEDELEKLTDMELLILYNIIDDSDLEMIFNEVKKEVLDYIHNEALTDKNIEYEDPPFRYVKFIDDDVSMEEESILAENWMSIAEVLKKVRPNEFLIHVIRKDTLPEGKMEELDLPYLKSECGLVPISSYEFHKLKKRLKFLTLSDNYEVQLNNN